MLRIACCLTVLLSQSALPEVPAPDIRDLVNRNTYTFSYTDAALDGPGAAHLRRQVADAQFVLLGEEHMDHAIPIFAGALYKTLHDSFGYRHLVVEQDPVAIEDALQPALRGDVDRIAAHAKQYPTLFEFDTDEDLGLLALVGTLEGNADAIWGVEQTTGAIRYLEELSKLAPDAAARSKVEQALVAARAADHEPSTASTG